VLEARGLGVRVALLRNACGLPRRSQHRRTGGLSSRTRLETVGRARASLEPLMLDNRDYVYQDGRLTRLAAVESRIFISGIPACPVPMSVDRGEWQR
jgi:hypothetical protein